MHDGYMATNNLIRIVIEGECLRGYVYQFLRNDIGQTVLDSIEHLEESIERSQAATDLGQSLLGVVQN